MSGKHDSWGLSLNLDRSTRTSQANSNAMAAAPPKYHDAKDGTGSQRTSPRLHSARATHAYPPLGYPFPLLTHAGGVGEGVAEILIDQVPPSTTVTTVTKFEPVGVAIGNHCIQIGTFRIGTVCGQERRVDENHLCIGHCDGMMVQVFRSDGTLHPSDGKRRDWNPWSMPLGRPAGVTLGDHCIQIGQFRIGAVCGQENRIDENHLCIGHKSGKMCQVFRSDGTLHPGGGTRTDWNPWSKDLGPSAGVHFGDHTIQIGRFRIGAVCGQENRVDSRHLCIGHEHGKMCQVFRSDGTLHDGHGTRTDWNPWGKTMSA